MKRILILLTAVLAVCLTASAQDLITKKDGTDIQARVLEVNPDNVKYVLFKEPEGPVYTVRKNELIMIRYASGRNEVFNNNPEPAAGIAPYMKYKTLKEMYHYKDYTHMPYDRFSPAWSGVASFIIPGLGQMMCEEVGRGFAYLGGTIGCYIITGLGGAIAAGSFTTYQNQYGDTIVEENLGGAVVGLLMAYAGMIGVVAVDIASIVDAVRVAKVKNMYEQEVRKKYAFDMDLYPSVNYVRTPTGAKPTAGITLAMRF